MQPFDYVAPGDIDAVLAAASAPDTKYIAGGTDLVQLMQDDVERPNHIVGLDRLPLDRIEFGPDGARIGALSSIP
jgi:xanthine dehydrogenase YagS FAD-binding subunit